VYVVNEGRVLSQVVSAGSEFGDRIEIKQGLAGGEKVVVQGAAGLTEGARVRTKSGS
jgi:hypothetical protein